MAKGALPPLTSVDPCLEEVGRVAATRLLAAIGGEHTDTACTGARPAGHPRVDRRLRRPDGVGAPARPGGACH